MARRRPATAPPGRRADAAGHEETEVHRMAKRVRDVDVHVCFTADEKAKVKQRMADAGIRNMSEFLLKMALNGYVLTLDLSEVREMVRLLSNATNNINQVAKRANETRSVGAADINALKAFVAGVWEQANGILAKLSKL